MQYLEDTALPEVPVYPLLNKHLAQYAQDNRDALLLCNADKGAVRQWAALIKEQHGTR